MKARPASGRFRNPPGGGVKQRGHFSTRFFPLVPNPPEQRTTPSKPASTTSLTLNRSQNSREPDASIRATVPGAAIAGDEGKQQRGHKRPCSTRSSATRFPTAAQRSRALLGPTPAHPRVRPHRGGPSRLPLPLPHGRGGARSRPRAAATARSTSPPSLTVCRGGRSLPPRVAAAPVRAPQRRRRCPHALNVASRRVAL